MKWAMLALVSAIFFVSTGGAFSSLGVLLPAMISDLGWNWTQGGAGFTVLALMTGLSSTLPAYTIRIGGMRLTYLSGGLILGGGFASLSAADGMFAYILGAGLVGVGYSQVASVPAVKLLSGWFPERRSLLIGLFFACGALGSVVGPLAASFFLGVLESWRLYWVCLASLVTSLCLVAAYLVYEKADQVDGGADGESAVSKGAEWTLQETLRSPQYYIIVIGLTATLLGAITMNTWQVTHMRNLDVSANIAAGALSAHAMFNALSRAVGGAVIDRLGAKWLFATGLGAGVVGMLALSVAKSPLLIALFAVGDGYSFGIVTFSSAILLLNYYGAKNSPAILGTMNLISTLAMTGPIVAGRIADVTGEFTSVFVGIAAILAAASAFAVWMPKPEKSGASLERKDEAPAS
ncbi:MAG: MFS transporter [Pseudomonadota bacterium]